MINNRNEFLPVAGTISSAHAVLGATERKFKSINTVLVQGTQYLLIDLSKDNNQFLELVSHVVGSNNDNNVIELYACRGQNWDLTYVASIALTAGQMTVCGGSRLYNDTATVTEKDAAFECVESCTAIDDMAKTWINTNGYKYFLILASTLNSTNIGLMYSTVNREGIPVVA